jgi:hypothetical protein
MGMAMGQDCELLGEVCSWINAKATKPVWAKMTPNITDVADPARVALGAGEGGRALWWGGGGGGSGGWWGAAWSSKQNGHKHSQQEPAARQAGRQAGVTHTWWVGGGNTEGHSLYPGAYALQLSRPCIAWHAQW